MERFILTEKIDGEESVHWLADFADEKTAFLCMYFIFHKNALKKAKGDMTLRRLDGTVLDYDGFEAEYEDRVRKKRSVRSLIY